MNWSTYAKNPNLMAVMDPADTKGHKNRYINILHHKVLANSIGTRLMGRSLLDVGCGVGRFNDLLLNRCGKVMGVDSCKDMISKNTNISVLSPITKLPFPDDKFDAALSVWTLQFLNVEDMETAIAEISRVLKTGSSMFLIEQMSIKGYDQVPARVPSVYWSHFIHNGFIQASMYPIMYSHSALLDLIRIGAIPECCHGVIADFQLLRMKNRPVYYDRADYVDWFMEFRKVC
jgi:SAM-dependent methyltransferase